MITIGEHYNLGAQGKGRKMGHRKHGVILNANGQVVAHIWGHAKVVDANFKFQPRPWVPRDKFMTGVGEGEDADEGMF